MTDARKSLNDRIRANLWPIPGRVPPLRPGAWYRVRRGGVVFGRWEEETHGPYRFVACFLVAGFGLEYPVYRFTRPDGQVREIAASRVLGVEEVERPGEV